DVEGAETEPLVQPDELRADRLGHACVGEIQARGPAQAEDLVAVPAVVGAAQVAVQPGELPDAPQGRLPHVLGQVGLLQQGFDGGDFRQRVLVHALSFCWGMAVSYRAGLRGGRPTHGRPGRASVRLLAAAALCYTPRPASRRTRPRPQGSLP